MSTRRWPLPKWADVILTPLIINLLLAFVISALVILAIGETRRGLKVMVDRRARQRPAMAGAIRCITPPTSSSPGWRWRSPITPACSISAARAGLCRRLGVGHGLPAFRCPGRIGRWPARRHRRRRRFRRALGADPGLAAGQARQPYRHHHHHVQLHRRGADELHAGRNVLRPPGSMDAGLGQLPARDASAQARPTLRAASASNGARTRPPTSPSCRALAAPAWRSGC
jgi:hypothetical protein